MTIGLRISLAGAGRAVPHYNGSTGKTWREVLRCILALVLVSAGSSQGLATVLVSVKAVLAAWRYQAWAHGSLSTDDKRIGSTNTKKFCALDDNTWQIKAIV